MPGADPNVNRPARGDRVERRHALVIGVDAYAEPALRLGFSTADATRMVEVLTARGYRVTALHDGPGAAAPATVGAVRDALAAITAAADEDDLVVVHASCRGRRIARRPYLLMADSPRTAAAIAGHGLALSELLTALRCKARWVGVFLDLCDMRLGLDPTAARSTVHSEEIEGGFALLAGGTSAAQARDPARAGLFSKQLAAGLAGGAADPDGAVRVSALARYVQDGLARWRGAGARAADRQASVVRLEVADLALCPPRGHLDLGPRPAAAITCAAFSRDGRRLVTGGADGSVRIWDPHTGAELRITLGHQAPVRAVAAASVEVFCSGSDDGVVNNWDLVRGDPYPPPVELGVPITAVTWKPTGIGRVIGTGDGVYVQEQEDVVASVARPWRIGAVSALALCDGGFITGGDDGRVCRWDTRERQGTVIGAHDGPVRSLAVSPDSRFVVAAGGGGGADGEPARLWDVEARTAIALPGHGGAVTGVAYAPDGLTVATACADGVVRLFAAPAGRLRRELTIEPAADAPTPAAAQVVTFAPAGDRLFVGYADGRGRLFTL